MLKASIMISFCNPKKQKMASGFERIELTEARNCETFPQFAKRYSERIGATVVKQIEAPEMHLWEIEYEGATLNSVYDDFPMEYQLSLKINAASQQLKNWSN
jgi:hypothetical protein